MFSSWSRHHNGYDSWGNSDSYWLGSRSYLGRMWPHNTVLSKAYACLFFSQTRPEACLCSWRGREGSGDKLRERNSGGSETVCVCLSLIASLEKGRSLSFQGKSKHGQHYSSRSLSAHDTGLHITDLICTAASQAAQLLNQKKNQLRW